jgi:hypothetical protein
MLPSPMLTSPSGQSLSPSLVFSSLCVLRVSAFSYLVSPFNSELSIEVPVPVGTVNLPSLSPFTATLASPLQSTEKLATLSPAFATLTRHVMHNPCVCHSYKKHGGWGTAPPLIRSSSLRTHLRGTAASHSAKLPRSDRDDGPLSKSLLHCLSHGGSHLELFRRSQPSGRTHSAVPKSSVPLTNHKTKASKTCSRDSWQELRWRCWFVRPPLPFAHRK